MSDLLLPAAGNSVDHTDGTATACQGEALTGRYEILANGVEHIDQAAQCGHIGQSEESHHSVQPNQPSERDTNQLDQSDQQTPLVKDKDEVARERDTNIVVPVDEEPVSLQLLPWSVEDSIAAPGNTEQEDVLQVTPSTCTMEAKTTTLDQKDQEVRILPDSKKSELFGGLASCDDFSVGKDLSPKPQKSTTMTPINQEQEEETIKGE